MTSPRTSKACGRCADFEFRRADVQRDAADGADVGGDVFAGGAVAAGDAGGECGFAVAASNVLQREREAVELELADEAWFVVGRKARLYAIGPGAEFVGVVGVVEREHGARVRDLGEALFGLAADALGGRVGRDELGVLGLERLEAVHGGVVLRVGPLGGIEHVVEVLVVAEEVAELFDLLIWREGFGRGLGGHRGNYRERVTLEGKERL